MRFETLAQDVRYALRALRKSPGFTATAVITLGLGIGANTAVFSVVNALLLRPPAGVTAFDRLAAVFTSDFSGPPYGTSSYADLQDFAAATPALSGIAGYGVSTVVLSEPESGRPAEVALVQTVTANYFDVLGVPMSLGRAFAPDEGRVGGPAAVVLGQRFWRTRYGADRGIVGRAIRLGGTPFTVIGVAPAGFDGLLPIFSPAFYVPVETATQVADVDLLQRGDRGLLAVARIADGASIEQARAQLTSVAADLFRRYPANWTDVSDQSRRVSVLPAAQALVPPQIRGSAVAFAAVLMAVVAALLLICCANIANLLLVRASAREREVGVRVALGAGRGRLIAQLLTESLVLAGAGAALGVALAFVGTRALADVQLPLPVDIRLNVTPDPAVLGFTLIVSVASALLFGLAPALIATRGSVSTSIRGDAPRAGLRGGRLGLRGVLAGGQITVAVVLLVMAGLLLRSLLSAQRMDPGFRTADLLFVDVAQDANTTTAEQRFTLHRALRDRVLTLPGVRAVSYTGALPLGGSYSRRGFGVEGYTPGAQEDMEVNMTTVGPGYLNVMGIALRAGREFTDADAPDAPRVAIVNEAFARRYLGGASPLGKRLGRGSSGALDIEIVGVARDGKYRSLSEEPLPYVYVAADQESRSAVTLVVHTAAGASGTADAVRRVVAELAPDAAVTRVTTPDQHLLYALLPQRAGASLLGLFGVLGLALAALGIYGVMAYAARRRAHEIGVRMALGAHSSDIVRMVVRQGMTLAALGGVVGLAIAAALSRLLGFLLFGIEPLDPVAFAAAAAVVAAVTLLANWMPARRSAAVSPISVLKGD